MSPSRSAGEGAGPPAESRRPAAKDIVRLREQGYEDAALHAHFAEETAKAKGASADDESEP